MHSREILRKGMAVIGFVLLIVASAAAWQYGNSNGDEGQYQILQARYGTAERNVDVTQRLKQLATQDRTFRMGNSTFGEDPDPGRVKTLRLYTRGPGGANRMFEYREGSVVDGSQFTGWGRGDWGSGGWNGGWGDSNSTGNGYGDDGQYQILQARYGTAQRNVDVTQRLKELASRDVTFRMGNSTFGVDPDQGRVKTLRIYARGPNGQNRMFEYREGSVIDGSLFTGWGNGNWGGGGWNGGWGDGNGSGDSGQYQILQARYGTPQRNVDVTERLKELARRDQTFRMGNSTFGIDPDEGRVKTLRIYTRGPGGGYRVFEYQEGSYVDGSQFTGWGGGNWGGGGWNGGWGDGDEGQYQILQARYGTARRNVDVTERLKELARRDVNFRMGNSTFGIDPDRGHVKTLRIYARGPNGGNRTFEYREGSVVDGALFSSWSGGNWGGGGWNGGWGNLGNDDWRDGRRVADRDRDGDRDRDRDYNRDDRGRYGQLNIVRATYGAGNRTQDVTGRLRSLVRDGRLQITVNNDSMGTDPAPGSRKTLSVSYSNGGNSQQQARVSEGGQLSIP